MVAHAYLPSEALIGNILQVVGIDDPIPAFHYLVGQSIYFDLDRAGITIDGKKTVAPVQACGFPQPAPRVEKPDGRALQLVLSMGAFRRLFHLDPNAITGRITPVDDPALDRLHAALAAAPDRVARIAIARRTLAALAEDALPRGMEEAALALLAVKRQPVTAVAEQLGITMRTLQRRFRARFGITPARMQRSFRAFRSTQQPNFPALTWANVPPDLEYADQSHWLRDLREVYAMPPKAFLENRRYEWRYYSRDGTSVAEPEDAPDWREYYNRTWQILEADLAGA